MSGFLIGPCGVAPAIGATTTTWDPLNANASLLPLTNGNLTATASAGGFISLRAIGSHSTGKYYWEIRADALAVPGNNLIGIANASASLSNYIGSDNNSIGASGGGAIQQGGSNVGSVATWVAGDTIGLAVDFGTQTMWWRTNAGFWNGNAPDDPATGTGGKTFTVAGPYFPAANTNAINDAWTANFGATAYAQTRPVGFGNW